MHVIEMFITVLVAGSRPARQGWDSFEVLSSGSSDGDCDMEHDSRRNALAIATAEFTGCIANNTAPDRYCFACADESLKYNQAYSNMSAKCQDYYMIKMMNGFFNDMKTGLWPIANCDSCPREKLERFTRVFDTYTACMNNNYGSNRTCGIDGCLREYTNVTTLWTAQKDECQYTADVVYEFRKTLQLWENATCTSKFSHHPGTTGAILSIAYGIVGLFYFLSWLATRQHTSVSLSDDREASVGAGSSNTGRQQRLERKPLIVDSTINDSGRRYSESEESDHQSTYIGFVESSRKRIGSHDGARNRSTAGRDHE